MKSLKTRLALSLSLVTLIVCLMFIGGWIANGTKGYVFDLQVIVSVLQVLKGFLEMFLGGGIFP